MKSWQLIVIVAVIIIGAAGLYLYQQQNRTLLSVETPGGSIEINENADGMSVDVKEQ